MSSKKALDVLNLIGKYIASTDGFDGVMKNIKFVEGGNGNCQAEITVKPEHLNKMGGLHGGFSSTIVDTITTYALMTKNVEDPNPGVSVDLHITFLKAARENDVLVIDAKTIKSGRTLAFLECEVRNKKCNSIIVRGSHTKFVGK